MNARLPGRLARWLAISVRAVALAMFASTASASTPVELWLNSAGIAPAQVGAIALPLSGSRALIEHNAAQPMNPASTIKLLTSYAVLSALGPDYRWRTGAFLRGRLESEVLYGDLILKGAGDPKLVIEDLTEFVARMRRAGLRVLRGDLVIDDAIYDVGDRSVEAFDAEPGQPYNVRPFGLLMNFKSTRVVVLPGEGGATITLDPPLAGVEIDNRLRIVRGACKLGSSALTVRDGEPGSVPKIVVGGAYAPSCGERSVFASVLSHREFVDALFRAAWQAAGGEWYGRARIERGAANGTPWLEWESPRTLADVVRDVNKFSNNVMSRHLLLHLAVAGGQLPATVDRARDAMQRWLVASRLELPSLVIENGSGLSRTERISAAALGRLLVDASASPNADLVRNSLPVVGVDGTMKHRMVGERIAGNAWIKTGSLSEVRAIAGYVDAASGKRYAVVMFFNGLRTEIAPSLQEQFLRWVHANG